MHATFLGFAHNYEQMNGYANMYANTNVFLCFYVNLHGLHIFMSHFLDCKIMYRKNTWIVQENIKTQVFKYL